MEDIEDNRAFVGLSAVLDRTYGHVDRGFVRKLLTQVNWIGECGIQEDMGAAYELLPSDLVLLSFRVSAIFPRLQEVKQSYPKTILT